MTEFGGFTVSINQEIISSIGRRRHNVNLIGRRFIQNVFRFFKRIVLWRPSDGDLWVCRQNGQLHLVDRVTPFVVRRSATVHFYRMITPHLIVPMTNLSLSSEWLRFPSCFVDPTQTLLQSAHGPVCLPNDQLYLVDRVIEIPFMFRRSDKDIYTEWPRTSSSFEWPDWACRPSVSIHVYLTRYISTKGRCPTYRTVLKYKTALHCFTTRHNNGTP